MIGFKRRLQYYGAAVVALLFYDYFLILQDEISGFPSTSRDAGLTF